MSEIVIAPPSDARLDFEQRQIEELGAIGLDGNMNNRVLEDACREGSCFRKQHRLRCADSLDPLG
jgi:hypothetical protein